MNGPQLDTDLNAMFYVYALTDPRSPDRIRYVGWAINPVARLSRHVQESRKTRASYTHKERWIRSLLFASVMPQLAVVASAGTREAAAAIEVEMIARCRSDGHDLTNGTRGGDGVVDRTPEVLEKMAAARRGKNCGRRSEEWRSNISAGLKAKGHRPPPEALLKSALTRKGKKVDRAVVERIASQLRGRKRPADVVQKYLDKVRSTEVRKKLSDAARRQWQEGRGWRKSEADGQRASEQRREAWRGGVYDERLRHRNSDGTWAEIRPSAPTGSQVPS